MKEKKNSDELELGMYVSELCCPWIDSPFLFQGFVITSEKELQKLQELCDYVYIDMERSDETIMEAARTGKPRPASQVIKVSAERKEIDNAVRELKTSKTITQDFSNNFDDEINAAEKIFEEAEESVSRLFDTVNADSKLSVLEAKNTVTGMVSSIVRNPDAMVLLSSLSAYDEGIVAHSMNVCTLSLALGRYIGMTKSQLMELGLAALLHDVGETRTPRELLDKRWGLTEEEKKIKEQHAEAGREILSALKGMPESVVDVAYSHHERINGQGYPLGIEGNNISEYAKMVAIADVYDRVTHVATKGKYITSTDALKSMYENRGIYFDTELTEKFIQCLGIYPVGSVVELSSGEVGIVISAEPKYHLVPKVLVVRNADKKPVLPPKILDLKRYREDSGEMKYRITKVLPPDAYGIDLNRYMMKEFRF